MNISEAGDEGLDCAILEDLAGLAEDAS